MGSKFTRRRPDKYRTTRPRHMPKPNGVLGPKVKAVGPSRFGIVSVDCAKARSKWMLCDFYNRELVAPTLVTHTRHDFEAMANAIRDAIKRYDLKDFVIAVERTGRYHQPIKRAMADHRFEVRIVHPFATKQFRMPANPGNKTDDTDLAAIHLAAVNGFGLIESNPDPLMREIAMLARHRRDLVQKTSKLCCQIREHLDATMPGYAAIFGDKLWDKSVVDQFEKECK